MKEELIPVGRIYKPHGIKGEVRVISYAESPSIFSDTPDIYLKDKKGPFRKVHPLKVSQAKDHLIIKLEEVKDRNAAEEICGSELFIQRCALPEPAEGEFYHIDLMGLHVFLHDGRKIGVITEIIQTKANDVFVVKDGEREYLFPVIKEVITEIDIEGGKIIVEPMEGML